MSTSSKIVNAITFARVPLIFLWMVLAIVHEFSIAPESPGGVFLYAFWACAAMLFSGLSDAFDGYLARKWNVVSTLGKMADPLMDKVFYIVALPTLVWQLMHQGAGAFHVIFVLALTILYILRDTWVTFMRSIGSMYGANVAAMMLGKVRTALSFPGIGWIYMYACFHGFCRSAGLVDIWLWSCYVVEALLLVLTVVSAITYTMAYVPHLKRALVTR